MRTIQATTTSRKVSTRVKKQTPLESNPRNPHTTILGDMQEIMRLVEKNKRIKGRTYDQI